MPIYEFRCRTCGARFEELRPMVDADTSVATAACPQGHDDVERLLSMVAPTSSAASPSPSGGGGACCASGCACGRN